jgi:hypothetical protein
MQILSGCRRPSWDPRVVLELGPGLETVLWETVGRYAFMKLRSVSSGLAVFASNQALQQNKHCVLQDISVIFKVFFIF